MPADGDDVGSYQTTLIKHPLSGAMVSALVQKPNGECVYLGENGCEIYDRAPALCRSFSCVSLYLRELERLKDLPRPTRRRAAKELERHPVLKAGRERVPKAG